MNKLWYIKERHNPQLGIYYIACGQMTKKEARKAERSLYGSNYMYSYSNEEDYNKAVISKSAKK